MAWTIPTCVQHTGTVDEVLQCACDTIADPHDFDQIAEMAPALSALANDRRVIAQALNQDLVNLLDGKAKLLYSQQSFILKEDSARRLTIRANIWPVMKSKPRSRALSDKVFAYQLPHDHNFSFLTVGYHGPGYETTIYEYDFDKVKGYVGEKIDIRFLEHTTLEQGKVMLFRSGRDIHIQYPPRELSISLNLIVGSAHALEHEQFAFDVEEGRITDLLTQSGITNSVGYLQFVKRFGGDERTYQLACALATRHANRNVRLAARECAAGLQPQAAEAIWIEGLSDRDDLVRDGSARRLACMREEAVMT